MPSLTPRRIGNAAAASGVEPGVRALASVVLFASAFGCTTPGST